MVSLCTSCQLPLSTRIYGPCRDQCIPASPIVSDDGHIFAPHAADSCRWSFSAGIHSIRSVEDLQKTCNTRKNDPNDEVSRGELHARIARLESEARSHSQICPLSSENNPSQMSMVSRRREAYDDDGDWIEGSICSNQACAATIAILERKIRQLENTVEVRTAELISANAKIARAESKNVDPFAWMDPIIRSGQSQRRSSNV